MAVGMMEQEEEEEEVSASNRHMEELWASEDNTKMDIWVVSPGDVPIQTIVI